MNFQKNKKLKFFSVIFLLFPILTVSSCQAYIYWGDTGNNYMTNGTYNYIEDFTTTTYQDPITNAEGWGTGMITNPRDYLVEQLDFFETPFPATSIDTQGRFVYYACYNTTDTTYSINALDCNDPENMFLTSYRNSLVGTRSIAVDGETLYSGRAGTSGSTQRFNSYNITDPYYLNGPLSYLDFITWDGQITDIELEGNMAYFAAYLSSTDLSFGVANITNPDDIFAITHDWYMELVYGLDVIGHLAYLATSSEGLYILNISSIKHPTHVGYLNTPGNATDVLVDGRYAYLVDGNAGLQIIDVSNPTIPVLRGTYNTPGFAQKLAKQGNTVFIADGSGGVQVVDVSNPLEPLGVTEFTLPYTNDVVLYGDLLFVATDEGIYSYQIGELMNLADSAYPNPYDSYQVKDIRVIDGIAYIAGGTDEFIVVNVRNPANPIEIYKSDFGGVTFNKIDVNEQFAFLVYTFGIYIFDISDLSNIHYADWMFGLGLTDVCLAGKYAYVAFVEG
ncbi:MAG: hypothetical protein FK734_20485, partial [Asgard group archaeon]|nr:hypothetical protein [Asgard group archaeon]